MKKTNIGVLFDSKCYSELIDELQLEIEELIKERDEKKTILKGLDKELEASLKKYSAKKNEVEKARSNIRDKKKQIKVFKKSLKKLKNAKIKLVKYNCENDQKKEKKFAKSIKGLTLNSTLDATQPLVANFLNTEKVLSNSMLEEKMQISACNEELHEMEKVLENLESELNKIDKEIKNIDIEINKIKTLLRKIKKYLLLDSRKTNKLNSFVLKDKTTISKPKFIPAKKKVHQKQNKKK